jgi:two-component system, NarL family, invasion response regulator UvrY
MHILIADDHAVVRRGLREILAEALPTATFAEAGSGDQVMSLLGKNVAQLLLLDINMPGRSGLEVLCDVKRLWPRIPVIVMSVQPADQYGVRCLRAGAAAYISKESAVEELAQAARKVLAGGRYVGPELAEKLIETIDKGENKNPHEMLSDREHEVMRMIAEGKGLTDVADALHVSVKTVSTYRSRILAKMQMKSNAELIRYAIEKNLVH